MQRVCGYEKKKKAGVWYGQTRSVTKTEAGKFILLMPKQFANATFID